MNVEAKMVQRGGSRSRFKVSANGGAGALDRVLAQFRLNGVAPETVMIRGMGEDFQEIELDCAALDAGVAIHLVNKIRAIVTVRTANVDVFDAAH